MQQILCTATHSNNHPATRAKDARFVRERCGFCLSNPCYNKDAGEEKNPRVKIM